MDYVKVRYQKLKDDAGDPSYSTSGAAGIDLPVYIESRRTEGVARYDFVRGGLGVLNTGLAFEIPKGYVGLVCDRSSTPLKLGLHVVAGVIDSDYRGEVRIIVHALSTIDPRGRVRIEHGQKVAQMIILRADQVDLEQAAELSCTERGGKWNASTGI